MKTIHVIFNAHIDPIWLWPWQAGLDEVLATCRAACDRLDAHPDIYFSRGEAWVYEQIERVDPILLNRIRQFVALGRWEIVGGWWIQPDCNAPSGFGIQKQIELGKTYFTETFGVFPRIAYNVDSFGHSATLPGYMRAAGQDRYVMMRPQEHEMDLPSRLFRWRGYADSPEVTVFRIASAYALQTEPSFEFLESSVSQLPDGINDTMCFLGVGDHGGGPTERQIAWCQQNESAIDGWKLKFSTPGRFFDAIERHQSLLPLVTGELQMHAVGCYSVFRPVKTALRKAENQLARADFMLSEEGQEASQTEIRNVNDAWKRVCFHQFHDTLGGTCLASAYEQVLDQLGHSSCVADEILQYGLRKKLTGFADDTAQRIALHNPSSQCFEDWIEYEPWLEYAGWNPEWRLIDETGNEVSFQIMESEALFAGSDNLKRLLFKLKLAPGQIRVLRIDKENRPSISKGVSVYSDEIANLCGVQWTSFRMTLPNLTLKLPTLTLIDDFTDTWSHGIQRYGENGTTAVWEAPIMLDTGPLMAACVQSGRIGNSILKAEWRVYAGEEFCELLLSIHWIEKHKILKLSVDCPNADMERIDGIMGGSIVRRNTGQEVPIQNWMRISAMGQGIGIVTTDTYAADVTLLRARLTLLRSPLMAHHDPDEGKSHRAHISDQGVHKFKFRFVGGRVSDTDLEAMVFAVQNAPVIADLTRGMPSRFDCM